MNKHLEVETKRDWDKIFPNFTPKTKEKAAETALAILELEDLDLVADKLKIHPDTLSYRVKKWNLDWCFTEKVSNAMRVLQIASTKAAKRKVALIDDRDKRLANDVSGDVLDRVGVTKPKEVSQTNVQVNNFGQAIGNLKKSIEWEDEE